MHLTRMMFTALLAALLLLHCVPASPVFDIIPARAAASREAAPPAEQTVSQAVAARQQKRNFRKLFQMFLKTKKKL